MKALIIVDIQNDFLPGGALPVSNGDEIIATINQLQQRYPLVVATQDWHPANHQSFASQHPGRNPFEKTTLNGLQQVLWPDHCIQGSLGAAFAPALDETKIEAIFRKGMDPQLDSYSGFFDNDKKKATGMAAYLKGRGVSTVDVCGLAADYCVYYTANDALNLGLQSTILDYATRAIDTERYEQIKQEFIQAGGHIEAFSL
ncbi:bifunctional nicotinamidase/pyrazinamidase [Olivibacter ginsenosidimutans]|uniref:nicotinamidase n=1 Tax=Olivibacter ginsenosidimutans TaxID=1176537 RepID=A0ABP9C6S7_9SPHI